MINSFKKDCQKNYFESSKLVSIVKSSMEGKNVFYSEHNNPNS